MGTEERSRKSESGESRGAETGIDQQLTTGSLTERTEVLDQRPPYETEHDTEVSVDVNSLQSELQTIVNSLSRRDSDREVENRLDSLLQRINAHLGRSVLSDESRSKLARLADVGRMYYMLAIALSELEIGRTLFDAGERELIEERASGHSRLDLDPPEPTTKPYSGDLLGSSHFENGGIRETHRTIRNAREFFRNALMGAHATQNQSVERLAQNGLKTCHLYEDLLRGRKLYTDGAMDLYDSLSAESDEILNTNLYERGQEKLEQADRLFESVAEICTSSDADFRPELAYANLGMAHVTSIRGRYLPDKLNNRKTLDMLDEPIDRLQIAYEEVIETDNEELLSLLVDWAAKEAQANEFWRAKIEDREMVLSFLMLNYDQRREFLELLDRKGTHSKKFWKDVERTLMVPSEYALIKGTTSTMRQLVWTVDLRRFLRQMRQEYSCARIDKQTFPGYGVDE